MTLTIQETGTRHKCSNCHTKTVATSHNGTVVVRAGNQVVFAQSLSVICPGCFHVNHISLVDSENGVD